MDFNSMFPSQYKQHSNNLVVRNTYIEVIAKLQKIVIIFIYVQMILPCVHNKNKWKKIK